MLISIDYPCRCSVRPSFRNNLFQVRFVGRVAPRICSLGCVMDDDRPYRVHFPLARWHIASVEKLTFSVVCTVVHIWISTQLSTLNNFVLTSKSISSNVCVWIYHWFQRVEPSVSRAAHCVNSGNVIPLSPRDTISTTSRRTCTHISGGFTTDCMNGLCSPARPSFTSSGCWSKFAYARSMYSMFNWFIKIICAVCPFSSLAQCDWVAICRSGCFYLTDIKVILNGKRNQH